MLRSLVIPGWGQLANRAWLKALLVAGADGWLRVRWITDERELTRLKAAADAAQRANDQPAYDAAAAAYNQRLDESTNRRWLLGAALAYSLLDAYVDAHFRNFEVDFETDPALPPGTPVGVRVSARWRW
jgi:hypothetical protein